MLMYTLQESRGVFSTYVFNIEPKTTLNVTKYLTICTGHRLAPVKVIIKQVLGRTDRQLSFDTTRTA